MSYEQVESIVQWLSAKVSFRPTVGIICGSGLGGLGDAVEEAISFPYSDIPHFPVSTVAGHKGRLVFGKLGGKEVVAMQGRFHMYEGHDIQKVVLPIRVMKLLGVQQLIVTNAAGGINPDYNVGDFMLIKDHISIGNMCGLCPLMGTNDERWGPRFPPASQCYNRNLLSHARTTAKTLGIESYVREGVYFFSTGPCYETIAECALIKLCGADAVGMSTAPEVITAVHCGLSVLGVSLITNNCILDYDSTSKTNHEEVLETGRMRAKDMEKFVISIISSF